MARLDPLDLFKVRGIPIMPVDIPGFPITQGQIWHVMPNSGSDSNDGKSQDQALATVDQALSNATADRNDIVLLYAESNSAGSTTSRVQTPPLAWNKDLTHLVGVAAPNGISQRARISNLSTWSPASDMDLVDVSADNCLFYNVHIGAFIGDANAIGAVHVTGNRNAFIDCHIAGIGHATQDAAGAYSLKLDGAEECLFKGCTIGLDTIARGTAANSEILIDTATTRCKFEDCMIISLIEHTTNHPLVKLADATSIDRWLMFKDCFFYSWSVNYATAQTGVFKLSAALTQGSILLVNCFANPGDRSSTVKWCADDRNNISLFSGPIPAGDTAGTPLEV